MGARKRNSSQKASISFSPSCMPLTAYHLDLHYNEVGLPVPSAAMPSNRPNLNLDEQSFQNLLSAAYTVQEHSDWLKRVRPAGIKSQGQPDSEGISYCAHCGGLKLPEESRCRNCGLDEFRPGERMQRKWASLWRMGQEQGLWPESHARAGKAAEDLGEAPQKTGEDRPESVSQFEGETMRTGTHSRSGKSQSVINTVALANSAVRNAWATESAVSARPGKETSALDHGDQTVRTFILSANELSDNVDFPLTEAATIEATTNDAAPTYATATDAVDEAQSISIRQRFANFRVTLRFHRADLYLGTAIFVATIALLWPAVSGPRRAGLGPVQRGLVALGIAEAPAPVVHLKGDPNTNVWIDPHTALYYCPGEEQYGKTADGRFSSQHEAHLDRFQPAGRTPCE